ncbi:MAG: hypothetical protein JO283_05285 [Bradyrhizobium sp.]|nr:hypothetical protein [Bradyrhizobium sp.]
MLFLAIDNPEINKNLHRKSKPFMSPCLSSLLPLALFLLPAKVYLALLGRELRFLLSFALAFELLRCKALRPFLQHGTRGCSQE